MQVSIQKMNVYIKDQKKEILKVIDEQSSEFINLPVKLNAFNSNFDQAKFNHEQSQISMNDQI